ncbi:MAG: hypothetical protein IIB69_10625 [Proteobacteria bacterium]|nr:hypothetical protein [Pseudomonadota bacterium]
MSHWLQHDEFVEMVMNYHDDNFTGLITGISDSKHSFQIGFNGGQIVLLTYRIIKGSAALDKIVAIKRAKITEHPTTELPNPQTELPSTSDILSRLSSTLTETETNLDTIRVPQPPQISQTSTGRVTEAKLRKIIEAAAVHHFGPVGAMVCEQHLSHADKNKADLRTLMLRIATDVGASELDTQAFIDTVAQG